MLFPFSALKNLKNPNQTQNTFLTLPKKATKPRLLQNKKKLSFKID